MKIVHIFADFCNGGAEHCAIYLAEESKKSGNETIFIIGSEDGAASLLRAKKIRYIVVPIRSSFNPFLLLRSLFQLMRIIKIEKIDIVNAHMLREHSIAIGAKFLGSGVRVVRTIHRLDQYNYKMKPLLWFYNWQTDAFIVITDYLKKQLNWVKPEKITVIANGVPKVEVSGHEKAIGFWGRLESEKGVFEFLKKSNYDGKVLIGGQGPEKTKIESLGMENVELVGQVADRADFLSRISVAILPSRTEVLPFTMIESFSAGVPVIAFDIPSLEGLINKNNGVSVKPFDNQGMAKEAKALLDDPRRLKELSAGAKEEYEKKYTINKMWQQTEALYKSLLS